MSYRRSFETALRHRDSMIEDIKALTESVILDIVDCEARVADGLSRSGDAGGTARCGDVSRPTERAALRLGGREAGVDANGVVRDAEPDTWTEREADPVAVAVNEFLAELAEAAGHLKAARRRIPVIVDAGARLRGRKDSIEQCRACDRDVLGTRDDRLRAGYCKACYDAWRREGMSERFEFERERRAELRRAKASGRVPVGSAKTAGR